MSRWYAKAISRHSPQRPIRSRNSGGVRSATGKPGEGRERMRGATATYDPATQARATRAYTGLVRGAPDLRGGPSRSCPPRRGPRFRWGQPCQRRVELPRRAAEPPRPSPRRPQRMQRQTTQFADRKSTRLNSSHGSISYAVFCLKKKKHSMAAPRTRCSRLYAMRLSRSWQPRHRSCFFLNDTATTEIYTLSLHDALPIYTPTANGCDRNGRDNLSSWDR